MTMWGHDIVHLQCGFDTFIIHLAAKTRDGYPRSLGYEETGDFTCIGR